MAYPGTAVNTENPGRKPLGELYFSLNTNGVSTKIPALSKHWLAPRVHAQYMTLPVIDGVVAPAQSAELDEWLAETAAFVQELEWLLGMEHYRFWSHMTLDPGCHATIVSFLQEATPFYTPLATLTADQRIHERYHRCLALTLKCIFRLLADRESATAWIAPDHHAKLLYTNFLITLPVCFDVLLACGRTNRPLMTQLFERVLRIDARYADDLREALVYLRTTLLGLQERIATDAGSSDAQLADMAAYALDCAATVALLLDCSAEAVQAAGDVQLEQALSAFYDQAVPMLYRQIYDVSDQAPGLAVLQQCRAELLRAFRAIVEGFLERVYADPENSILPAEYMLAVLQEALSDPVFVVDYKRLYPVEQDFDVIQQACPELDMVKVKFLQTAYTATTDEHFLTTSTYPPPPPSSTNRTIAATASGPNAHDDNDDDCEGAAAWPATADDSAAATRIQTVRDVLPHLQPSFVAALLARYSDNPEQVIAAVLEGNLPPDMQPDAEQDATATGAGAKEPTVAPAAQRPADPFGFGDGANVIVKRNKGFPGQARNLAALLDDKTHVRQLRSRYQEWGLVAEREEEANAANGYDDEYDDSYDALADSERRSGATRATAVRNPNRAVRDELVDDADEEDDDEEDEEEDEEGGGEGQQQQQQQQQQRGGGGGSSYYDKSKNFCENPEVQRERRAQQWNNKWAARAPRRPQATGGGGQAAGGGGGQAPQRTQGGDVVGKPKGQGQDASTQRSRAKKEASKTTKANHSRRSGAAWKRNTGMIPS